MLTTHQQEAFDKILELIKTGNKRIRLVGSAGTGKTYLVSELVKFVQRDRTINPNYNNGMVYVTAPTNKALSILQGKIDTRVEFKTIHSALKMRRYTNPKSGQKMFVRGTGKNDFNFAKICFIDECSMLNSDFIGGNDNLKKECIKPYLEDYGFPIIFIGDDKQLNPVGEEFSPVFHQDYPEVKLTEIIRQGAGNPIIDLSRDIDKIYFKKPKIVDGKGYLYSQNIESIIDDLAEVNGTDDLKYLAYTNLVVDSINQSVRERRYGKPNKIEKLETIVFNSPYGNNFTNKEVKVEDLVVVTDNIGVPRESTKFNHEGPINAIDYIKMKYYRINDSINIVHEHSESVYKVVLTTLNENCKRYGWDYRCKDFFTDQFADIKYNHAITIHKSQGSTYKETILNIGDINLNRNAEEKQRLLYTGITRASDLIILNNVK